MSLSSAVANIVTSFLQKFVCAECLNDRQEEELQWTNLQISPRYLLENHSLPYLISSGIIGRISVNIPWNLYLSTEMISVYAENIYLCIIPYSHKEWSNEYVRSLEIKRREGVIDAFLKELIEAHETDADKTQLLYIPDFIRRNSYAWLFRRINLKIINFHIRFESGLSHCFPFSLGLFVSYFTMTRSKIARGTDRHKDSRKLTKDSLKHLSCTLAFYYKPNDENAKYTRCKKTLFPYLIDKSVIQLSKIINRHCSTEMQISHSESIVLHHLQINVDRRFTTKNTGYFNAKNFKDKRTQNDPQSSSSLKYIIPPWVMNGTVEMPYNKEQGHAHISLPNIQCSAFIGTSFIQDFMSIWHYLRQWDLYRFSVCAAATHVQFHTSVYDLKPKLRWETAVHRITYHLALQNPLLHWFQPPIIRLIKMHNMFTSLSDGYIHEIRNGRHGGSLPNFTKNALKDFAPFITDFNIRFPVLVLWIEEVREANRSLKRKEVNHHNYLKAFLASMPLTWPRDVGASSVRKATQMYSKAKTFITHYWDALPVISERVQTKLSYGEALHRLNSIDFNSSGRLKDLQSQDLRTLYFYVDVYVSFSTCRIVLSLDSRQCLGSKTLKGTERRGSTPTNSPLKKSPDLKKNMFSKPNRQKPLELNLHNLRLMSLFGNMSSSDVLPAEYRVTEECNAGKPYTLSKQCVPTEVGDTTDTAFHLFKYPLNVYITIDFIYFGLSNPTFHETNNDYSTAIFFTDSTQNDRLDSQTSMILSPCPAESERKPDVLRRLLGDIQVQRSASQNEANESSSLKPEQSDLEEPGSSSSIDTTSNSVAVATHLNNDTLPAVYFYRTLKEFQFVIKNPVLHYSRASAQQLLQSTQRIYSNYITCLRYGNIFPEPSVDASNTHNISDDVYYTDVYNRIPMKYFNNVKQHSEMSLNIFRNELNEGNHEGAPKSKLSMSRNNFKSSYFSSSSSSPPSSSSVNQDNYACKDVRKFSPEKDGRPFSHVVIYRFLLLVTLPQQTTHEWNSASIKKIFNFKNRKKSPLVASKGETGIYLLFHVDKLLGFLQQNVRKTAYSGVPSIAGSITFSNAHLHVSNRLNSIQNLWKTADSRIQLIRHTSSENIWKFVDLLKASASVSSRSTKQNKEYLMNPPTTQQESKGTLDGQNNSSSRTPSCDRVPKRVLPLFVITGTFTWKNERIMLRPLKKLESIYHYIVDISTLQCFVNSESLPFFRNVINALESEFMRATTRPELSRKIFIMVERLLRNRAIDYAVSLEKASTVCYRIYRYLCSALVASLRCFHISWRPGEHPSDTLYAEPMELLKINLHKKSYSQPLTVQKSSGYISVWIEVLRMRSHYSKNKACSLVIWLYSMHPLYQPQPLAIIQPQKLQKNLDGRYLDLFSNTFIFFDAENNLPFSSRVPLFACGTPTIVLRFANMALCSSPAHTYIPFYVFLKTSFSSSLDCIKMLPRYTTPHHKFCATRGLHYFVLQVFAYASNFSILCYNAQRRHRRKEPLNLYASRMSFITLRLFYILFKREKNPTLDFSAIMISKIYLEMFDGGKKTVLLQGDEYSALPKEMLYEESKEETCVEDHNDTMSGSASQSKIPSSVKTLSRSKIPNRSNIPALSAAEMSMSATAENRLSFLSDSKRRPKDRLETSVAFSELGPLSLSDTRLLYSSGEQTIEPSGNSSNYSERSGRIGCRVGPKYWLPGDLLRYNNALDWRLFYSLKEPGFSFGFRQHQSIVVIELDFKRKRSSVTLGPLEIVINPLILRQLTFTMITMFRTFFLHDLLRVTYTFQKKRISTITQEEQESDLLKKNQTFDNVTLFFNSVSVLFVQRSSSDIEMGRFTLVGLRVAKCDDVSFELVLQGCVLTGTTRMPIFYGVWAHHPIKRSRSAMVCLEKKISTVYIGDPYDHQRIFDYFNSAALFFLRIKYETTGRSLQDKVVSFSQNRSTPHVPFNFSPNGAIPNEKSCTNISLIYTKITIAPTRINVRYDEWILLFEFSRSIFVSIVQISWALMRIKDELLWKTSTEVLIKRAAGDNSVKIKDTRFFLYEVSSQLPYICVCSPPDIHIKYMTDITERFNDNVVLDLGFLTITSNLIEELDVLPREFYATTSIQPSLSSRSTHNNWEAFEESKLHDTTHVKATVTGSSFQPTNAQRQQFNNLFSKYRSNDSHGLNVNSSLKDHARSSYCLPCVHYSVLYIMGPLLIKRNLLSDSCNCMFLNSILLRDAKREKDNAAEYSPPVPYNYYPLSTSTDVSASIWKINCNGSENAKLPTPWINMRSESATETVENNDHLHQHNCELDSICSKLFIKIDVKPFSAIMHPIVFKSIRMNTLLRVPVMSISSVLQQSIFSFSALEGYFYSARPQKHSGQRSLLRKRPWNRVAGFSNNYTPYFVLFRDSSSYSRRPKTTYGTHTNSLKHSLRQPTSSSKHQFIAIPNKNPLRSSLKSVKPSQYTYYTKRDNYLDFSPSLMDAFTGRTSKCYEARTSTYNARSFQHKRIINVLMYLMDTFHSSFHCAFPQWHSIEESYGAVHLIGSFEQFTLYLIDARGNPSFEAKILNTTLQHHGSTCYTKFSIRNVALLESVSTARMGASTSSLSTRGLPILQFPKGETEASSCCFSWISRPVEERTLTCTYPFRRIKTIIHLHQPHVRIHPTVIGAFQILVGRAVMVFCNDNLVKDYHSRDTENMFSQLDEVNKLNETSINGKVPSDYHGHMSLYFFWPILRQKEISDLKSVATSPDDGAEFSQGLHDRLGVLHTSMPNWQFPFHSLSQQESHLDSNYLDVRGEAEDTYKKRKVTPKLLLNSREELLHMPISEALTCVQLHAMKFYYSLDAMKGLNHSGKQKHLDLENRFKKQDILDLETGPLDILSTLGVFHERESDHNYVLKRKDMEGNLFTIETTHDYIFEMPDFKVKLIIPSAHRSSHLVQDRNIIQFSGSCIATSHHKYLELILSTPDNTMVHSSFPILVNFKHRFLDLKVTQQRNQYNHRYKHWIIKDPTPVSKNTRNSLSQFETLILKFQSSISYCVHNPVIKRLTEHFRRQSEHVENLSKLRFFFSSAYQEGEANSDVDLDTTPRLRISKCSDGENVEISPYPDCSPIAVYTAECGDYYSSFLHKSDVNYSKENISRSAPDNVNYCNHSEETHRHTQHETTQRANDATAFDTCVSSNGDYYHSSQKSGEEGQITTPLQHDSNVGQSSDFPCSHVQATEPFGTPDHRKKDKNSHEGFFCVFPFKSLLDDVFNETWTVKSLCNESHLLDASAGYTEINLAPGILRDVFRFYNWFSFNEKAVPQEPLEQLRRISPPKPKRTDAPASLAARKVAPTASLTRHFTKISFLEDYEDPEVYLSSFRQSVSVKKFLRSLLGHSSSKLQYSEYWFFLKPTVKANIRLNGLKITIFMKLFIERAPAFNKSAALTDVELDNPIHVARKHPFTVPSEEYMNGLPVLVLSIESISISAFSGLRMHPTKCLQQIFSSLHFGKRGRKSSRNQKRVFGAPPPFESLLNAIVKENVSCISQVWDSRISLKVKAFQYSSSTWEPIIEERILTCIVLETPEKKTIFTHYQPVEILITHWMQNQLMYTALGFQSSVSYNFDEWERRKMLFWRLRNAEWLARDDTSYNPKSDVPITSFLAVEPSSTTVTNKQQMPRHIFEIGNGFRSESLSRKKYLARSVRKRGRKRMLYIPPQINLTTNRCPQFFDLLSLECDVINIDSHLTSVYPCRIRLPAFPAFLHNELNPRVIFQNSTNMAIYLYFLRISEPALCPHHPLQGRLFYIPPTAMVAIKHSTLSRCMLFNLEACTHSSIQPKNVHEESNSTNPANSIFRKENQTVANAEYHCNPLLFCSCHIFIVNPQHMRWKRKKRLKMMSKKYHRLRSISHRPVYDGRSRSCTSILDSRRNDDLIEIITSWISTSQTVYGVIPNVSFTTNLNAPRVLWPSQSPPICRQPEDHDNFLILQSSSCVFYPNFQWSTRISRNAKSQMLETDNCLVFTCSSSILIHNVCSNCLGFSPKQSHDHKLKRLTRFVVQPGRSFALNPKLVRAIGSLNIYHIVQEPRYRILDDAQSNKKVVGRECHSNDRSNSDKQTGKFKSVLTGEEDAKTSLEKPVMNSQETRENISVHSSCLTQKPSITTENQYKEGTFHWTDASLIEPKGTKKHNTLVWSIVELRPISKFSWHKSNLSYSDHLHNACDETQLTQHTSKQYAILILSKIPIRQAELEKEKPLDAPVILVQKLLTFKAPLYIFNALPVALCIRISENVVSQDDFTSRSLHYNTVTILPNQGSPFVHCSVVQSGFFISFCFEGVTKWSSWYRVWNGLRDYCFPSFTCRIKKTLVTLYDISCGNQVEFMVVTSLTLSPLPHGWYGSCGAVTLCVVPERLAVSRLPLHGLRFGGVDRGLVTKTFHGDGQHFPSFLSRGGIRIGIPCITPDHKSNVADASKVSYKKSNPRDGMRSLLDSRHELYYCQPGTLHGKTFKPLSREVTKKLPAHQSRDNSQCSGVYLKRPLTTLGDFFCCERLKRPTHAKQGIRGSSTHLSDKVKWPQTFGKKRCNLMSCNCIWSSILLNWRCYKRERSYTHWITRRGSKSLSDAHKNAQQLIWSDVLWSSCFQTSNYFPINIGTWNLIIVRHTVPYTYGLSASTNLSLPLPILSISQLSLILRGLPPSGALPFFDRRVGGQHPETFSIIGYRGPKAVKTTVKSAKDNRPKEDSLSRYVDTWFDPETTHDYYDRLFYYYTGGLNYRKSVLSYFKKAYHDAGLCSGMFTILNPSVCPGNITSPLEEEKNLEDDTREIEVWEILPRYLVENRTAFHLELATFNECTEEVIRNTTSATGEVGEIKGSNLDSCLGNLCYPKEKTWTSRPLHVFQRNQLLSVYRLPPGVMAIVNFHDNASIHDVMKRRIRIRLAVNATLNFHSQDESPSFQHANHVGKLRPKVKKHQKATHTDGLHTVMSSYSCAANNVRLGIKDTKKTKSVLHKKRSQSDLSKPFKRRVRGSRQNRSVWTLSLPVTEEDRKSDPGYLLDTTFWNQYVQSMPLQCRDIGSNVVTVAQVHYNPRTCSSTGITRLTIQPSFKVFHFIENHSSTSPIFVRQPECSETQIEVKPLSSTPFWFICPRPSFEKGLGCSLEKDMSNGSVTEYLQIRTTAHGSSWELLNIQKLYEANGCLKLSDADPYGGSFLVHCRRECVSLVVSVWDSASIRARDLKHMLTKRLARMQTTHLSVWLCLSRLDISLIGVQKELFSFSLRGISLKMNIKNMTDNTILRNEIKTQFQLHSLYIIHFPQDIPPSVTANTLSLQHNCSHIQENSFQQLEKSYLLFCSKEIKQNHDLDTLGNRPSSKTGAFIVLTAKSIAERDNVMPGTDIPIAHYGLRILYFDTTISPFDLRLDIARLFTDVEDILGASWKNNPFLVRSDVPQIPFASPTLFPLASRQVSILSLHHKSPSLFSKPDVLQLEVLRLSKIDISSFCVLLVKGEETLYERHIVRESNEETTDDYKTACFLSSFLDVVSPKQRICRSVNQNILALLFYLLSIENATLTFNGFTLYPSRNNLFDSSVVLLTPNDLQQLYSYLRRQGLVLLSSTRLCGRLHQRLRNVMRYFKYSDPNVNAPTTKGRKSPLVNTNNLSALNNLVYECSRKSYLLLRTLGSSADDTEIINVLNKNVGSGEIYISSQDAHVEESREAHMKPLSSIDDLQTASSFKNQMNATSGHLALRPIVILLHMIIERCICLRDALLHSLHGHIHGCQRDITIRLPRMLYGEFLTLREYEPIDAFVFLALNQQKQQLPSRCHFQYAFYAKLRCVMSSCFLVLTAQRLLYVQLNARSEAVGQPLRCTRILWNRCLGSLVTASVQCSSRTPRGRRNALKSLHKIVISFQRQQRCWCSECSWLYNGDARLDNQQLSTPLAHSETKHDSSDWREVFDSDYATPVRHLGERVILTIVMLGRHPSTQEITTRRFHMPVGDYQSVLHFLKVLVTMHCCFIRVT